MERIAVLGAGSWGTALAFVLAENGHDVRIWGT
ncbi:glycerol-3-phosphate dehydrogenase [Priestia megaterium]